MSLALPESVIAQRMAEDNPWWMGRSVPFHALSPRDYYDLFSKLVDIPVARAIVLMGPRRVGKTVLLHHLIRDFIERGENPAAIFYCSVDTPTYQGMPLEKLLELFEGRSPHDKLGKRLVIFDEIQYLRDWETHLKVLVDKMPATKFIASGSAAAALKLKSQESGAGRFTDFVLPPLTFAEFLRLSRHEDMIFSSAQDFYETKDINRLNDLFMDYLNFGGYPEAVVSESVAQDVRRFIGKDIVEKVLLKDLPSLYGIQDIQELNRLFSTLAYHTAQEISLEQLSMSSNVAKNTIGKYLEYLEAAFLIWRVHKVDQSAKNFKRVRNFKVYLTNPAMRAALFGPVDQDSEETGHLVESGIFSQWFHDDIKKGCHYSRWNGGEVDMVFLTERMQKPEWALEVKWSDRFVHNMNELSGLMEFVKENRIKSVVVTTRSQRKTITRNGVEYKFIPAALYCYTVGKNIVRSKSSRGDKGVDIASSFLK